MEGTMSSHTIPGSVQGTFLVVEMWMQHVPNS